MRKKVRWLKRKLGKRSWLLGFLGLLGFQGFDYFTTGNVNDLFLFSNFAFFTGFIPGKSWDEVSDERFVENCRKAAEGSWFIPMMALFILGVTSSWDTFSQEYVVIVSALGWAATIITYALLLRHYEKQ